jgi:predicted dehydrogenase
MRSEGDRRLNDKTPFCFLFFSLYYGVMKKQCMKVGIAGVGRFGSRHLEKWLHFNDVEIAGFYDIDPEVGRKVRDEKQIPWKELDELLENIDVLDIVTPGSQHYKIAKKALQAGKHIFVEKPFTEFEDQAAELSALAAKKGLLVGVGHIEHFNPVFRALKRHLPGIPEEIRAYRQGPFLPGVGVDVSIVLELMIHDIELLTQLIPYPLKSVSAEGHIVHSDKIDRATATLTFENGSVAELFASRAESTRRRELICHSESGLFKANFMERLLEVPGHKQPRHFEANDAMAEELRSFLDAVKSGEKPVISEEQGLRSVSIANAIEKTILKKL